MAQKTSKTKTTKSNKSPSEIRDFRKAFIQKYTNHSDFFNNLIRKKPEKIPKLIHSTKNEDIRVLYNLVEELLSTRFLSDKGTALISRKNRKKLKNVNSIKKLVKLHKHKDGKNWSLEFFKGFLTENTSNAKALGYMLQPLVKKPYSDFESSSSTSSSETSSTTSPSNSSSSESESEGEVQKITGDNTTTTENKIVNSAQNNAEVLEPKEDSNAQT